MSSYFINVENIGKEKTSFDNTYVQDLLQLENEHLLLRLHQLEVCLEQQIQNNLHLQQKIRKLIKKSLANNARTKSGNSFPNKFQAKVLAMYAPFFKLFATPEWVQKYNADPENFWARTKNPLNRCVRALLLCLGPKPLKKKGRRK